MGVEVAEQVYRLGTKWANFYLVVEQDDALLIDAGYPGYWGQLEECSRVLRRGLGAITAVLTTHHHVDHIGTAERLQRTVGARVFAHTDDAPVIGGERRSHVPPGFYRQSWRPSMARYLAHTVAVGGARYRPVKAVEPFTCEQVLDLPASPRVIPTPGHTAGHYAVSLEARGVLFAGDTMVNFDYAAGEVGLKPHRFNEDRSRALASLARFEGRDAEVILFGHGDPWHGGVRRALERVRERA